MTAKRHDSAIDAGTGLLVVVGGALAALFVGMYWGPRIYLNRGGGPWIDLLPATFAAWEAHRPGEHFFMAFMSADDFAAGKAYSHYSQPLLWLEYLCLQPLRWLGIPYGRAQIALCLPQFAVLLALLAAHVRVPATPLRPLPLLRLGVMTLAAAGVVTQPAFWIPFFRFNPEQYFFLPALAFCHLAAVDYGRRPRRCDALLTLVPIALLAPVFAPFLVISWFILWEIGSSQGEGVRWRTVAWLAAIAVLAVVVFELPAIIDRFSTLTAIGSGFRFRSGLDGSQKHFTSMVQALWAPSYPPGRAWLLWQWPAAALAAIAAAATRAPATAAKMARQLFIAWVPLLWMVIVFPQLVSIHPYYFDFHLTLGASFCLLYWMQLTRLDDWAVSPPLRLAIVMAFAALLMTNLIDLTRLGAFPIELAATARRE